MNGERKYANYKFYSLNREKAAKYLPIFGNFPTAISSRKSRFQGGFRSFENSVAIIDSI